MTTSPEVLIIDDVEDARDMLAALLRHFGYRTRTACDGYDGLRAVGDGVPDAIIVDSHMPGMDGGAFIRTLRDMPELPTIPIILLSGDHRAGNTAADAAVLYLPKPLQVTLLLDTLRALMPSLPS